LTDNSRYKKRASKIETLSKFTALVVAVQGRNWEEILALIKKDIDINENIIKIDKALVFKKNRGEINLSPKLEMSMYLKISQ